MNKMRIVISSNDGEKMSAILEILKDSEVVIGMKLSSIPTIMETLVKSFDRIYDLVQQKKQNIVTENIPILG